MVEKGLDADVFEAAELAAIGLAKVKADDAELDPNDGAGAAAPKAGAATPNERADPAEVAPKAKLGVEEAPNVGVDVAAGVGAAPNAGAGVGPNIKALLTV